MDLEFYLYYQISKVAHFGQTCRLSLISAWITALHLSVIHPKADAAAKRAKG
jgi:hypothetical protein